MYNSFLFNRFSSICAQIKNQKEKPILLGCIWVNKLDSFALESGGSKLQFPFHRCAQFWKYCKNRLCNSFGIILGQIIKIDIMPPKEKKREDYKTYKSLTTKTRLSIL
jgi:hypothetical protein